MDGILLDNWSLEDLIEGYSYESNKAYYNLLETIVLWDKLYYPENEYSLWWKHISQDNSIKKVLIPFPDNNSEFQDEAVDIFNNLKDSDKYSRIVGIGGIRYSLLSNNSGLDYFPCIKRSEFLSCINRKQFYSEMMNRFKLTYALDNEVKKYYAELSEFLGTNEIQFEVPLLADYIIQNTPSSMSHIEFAIQLREEKGIKSYRRYLHKIEEAFNNGNWNKIFIYKDATKEIVHEIFKDKPVVESAGCDILAAPSINVSFTKHPIIKYVHLNFLRKVTKFAYKNRKKY